VMRAEFRGTIMTRRERTRVREAFSTMILV